MKNSALALFAVLFSAVILHSQTVGPGYLNVIEVDPTPVAEFVHSTPAAQTVLTHFVKFDDFGTTSLVLTGSCGQVDVWTRLESPYVPFDGTYIVDFLWSSTSYDNNLSLVFADGDTTAYPLHNGYSLPGPGENAATLDSTHTTSYLVTSHGESTGAYLRNYNTSIGAIVYSDEYPDVVMYQHENMTLVFIEDSNDPRFQDWNDGIFLVTQVPEPNTLALLAALGIFGFMIVRRR